MKLRRMGLGMLVLGVGAIALVWGGRASGQDPAIVLQDGGVQFPDGSVLDSGLISAVADTGQTTCWNDMGVEIECGGSGQDGEHQAGVSWPTPRFDDLGDGGVIDNLTGLVWLKDANCFGAVAWGSALGAADGLSSGDCGLTDGSLEDDWRLPNAMEMVSLINWEVHSPALPAGHPFTGVQSDWYWSSTSDQTDPDGAWGVRLTDGSIGNDGKTGALRFVWPVRGGK